MVEDAHQNKDLDVASLSLKRTARKPIAPEPRKLEPNKKQDEMPCNIPKQACNNNLVIETTALIQCAWSFIS